MKDNKWGISNKEQKTLVDSLAQELSALRAKIGISQVEIAELIGVSRQTYSAIESMKKQMSWNTYLSLIFFFDYNYATHIMIRQMKLFPDNLIRMLNQNDDAKLEKLFVSKTTSDTGIMLSALDEKGAHTVNTVLKVEYERCQSNNL